MHDACKEGLGGVLSQNGHVVCYESRKLKEHKRLYATHDLELATIVHALKMWRHYLMGRKFELRTDHSGLKYLFGQPTLNARKSRWLELLSEYDFDIRHIKGKENKVVDALNRRAHEIHATTINMCKPDLQNIILEAAKTDQTYEEMKEKLRQGKLQQKIENFELKEDKILMFKNRIYVPDNQELKNLLLSEMHKVPYVGHPGYQKTITTAKKLYYWPGMKKEVAYFIAKCLECQKSRLSIDTQQVYYNLFPFQSGNGKW
jgi:hypothetical protein